jgi:hypothetical protein
MREGGGEGSGGGDREKGCDRVGDVQPVVHDGGCRRWLVAAGTPPSCRAVTLVPKVELEFSVLEEIDPW